MHPSKHLLVMLLKPHQFEARLKCGCQLTVLVLKGMTQNRFFFSYQGRH
jgi:hypothetical protein